jgi:hypothetical protein
VKVDSYVVESNIHFPTDVNLLYDSGRKCLDMILKLGRKYDCILEGWRNLHYWSCELRNKERGLSQVISRGGGNHQRRKQAAASEYLEVAEKLSAKISHTQATLGQTPSDPTIQALWVLLAHYHQFLDQHIDLVGRRLLKGEQIPHRDKLFSIFEPWTEWINKGKRHKSVELGLNVLIATDQHHFILHHHLMQKEADVALAVPTARQICQKYNIEMLQSISFDRGFYSQPNWKNLQQFAIDVILPKKGKKNQEEHSRESQEAFVKLRRKHSAVEANINQLEHHGLNRCPDKGLKAFRRYVALGVLAYNIHRIGKILQQEQKREQKKELARKNKKQQHKRAA